MSPDPFLETMLLLLGVVLPLLGVPLDAVPLVESVTFVTFEAPRCNMRWRGDAGGVGVGVAGGDGAGVDAGVRVAGVIMPDVDVARQPGLP